MGLFCFSGDEKLTTFPPKIEFSIWFLVESILYCSRMVVKSGGNWKRPVNRMYTYNFQVTTAPLSLGTDQRVKLAIPDWWELLSAHDQLPGDQDRDPLRRARTSLFLRENLTPPTERHQVVTVKLPLSCLVLSCLSQSWQISYKYSSPARIRASTIIIYYQGF